MHLGWFFPYVAVPLGGLYLPFARLYVDWKEQIVYERPLALAAWLPKQKLTLVVGLCLSPASFQTFGAVYYTSLSLSPQL